MFTLLFVVYGDFKLRDTNTGELFTVEEAMKRKTDEDTIYNAELVSDLKYTKRISKNKHLNVNNFIHEVNYE